MRRIAPVVAACALFACASTPREAPTVVLATSRDLDGTACTVSVRAGLGVSSDSAHALACSLGPDLGLRLRACVPGCRSVPNPWWCDRDPPDERSLLDQLRVEKILLVRIDGLDIKASDAQLAGTVAATVFLRSAGDASPVFVATIETSHSADCPTLDAPDARRAMEAALTNSLSIAAASLFYDHAATPTRGSL